jgi:hypothetical protein
VHARAHTVPRCSVHYVISYRIMIVFWWAPGASLTGGKVASEAEKSSTANANVRNICGSVSALCVCLKGSVLNEAQGNDS